MPELPEVETTRRGVEPHCVGRAIAGVVVREPRLRWPVPNQLATLLVGQIIESVERRAKYLLFRTQTGSLLVHLGMSGSLRLVDADASPARHDHIDVLLTMRYACATTILDALDAFFGWVLARITRYWLTLGRSPFLHSLTAIFCISVPGAARVPLRISSWTAKWWLVSVTFMLTRRCLYPESVQIALQEGFQQPAISVWPKT